jgi:DNA-binding response OmpR family regulator
VESLLRRKNWAHNANNATAGRSPQGPGKADIFRFDNKEVDFRNLQLRAGEKIVQLTVMETDLLRYLIKNAGHPVSRKAILQDVWNLHEETDTRAIDSFVVRLRKYIEPKPSKPRYLLTIRGLGYQFVAKPQD